MRTRLDIEKSENDLLAPYAMRACDSWGRRHAEPEHFSRTCFQRDRDRVVHCEAFRKLEYKTQVFVIFEGDYYRTRLTHTIEVAQLARTIGRNLSLNEDLIEAVALAHDLGHSPFGHAGEQVLDERLKAVGLEGFNHNQRSFEIVSKFEKRYPDFDGLNLTVEVLVGILKHETLYDRKGEMKVVEDVPFRAKLLKRACPLEAQVVDKSDSLAYLNHDVDDGLTSGCITADDLNESRLWRRAVEKVRRPGVETGSDMFKYQVVKELIDMQVRDLLTATNERVERFKLATFEDVALCPEKRIVNFSDEMRNDREHLQSILNEKLYQHWRVERMTSKAKRILNELFSVYMDNPKQLPYDVFDRARKYSDKQLHVIICNYIAAMTDRAALDEYKRLFEPYEKV
ncbi:MAG: deoxyguanosinetriphosphate triphosphohydrolase [Candidatus Omnitrophica bacterium]|nr:deoxyguanosinetriphosphate triphosphohydrolase [Candidatus Omnitrophota bacterium]